MIGKISYWLFVLFPFASCTQQVNAQIPLDTTYTVASTYRKLIKQYPNIHPVKTSADAGIKQVTNIVYRNIPDTPFGIRNLHADLFLPSNSKKLFPTLIIIHGGGWRSGNKSLNNEMAKTLAVRGFAVASVEYRLSLEAKYPAAIDDINSFIEWLLKNGNQYQLDTSRIVLIGYSAGGQLASLVGINKGTPLIDAVINLDGLLDFTNEESLALKRTENSADVFWFGTTYEQNPDRWKEASPLYHVDKNAPPFLFINSSQTRFHAGCADMVKRLTEYGIYNQVVKFEDAPHSFWFFNPWFDPMMDHMSQFLNNILKSPMK